MFEKTLRQERQDDTSQTGWQTIYCSLMLILVVFFLMLISISSAEQGSLKRLQGSLGDRDGLAKDKTGNIGAGGTGTPSSTGTPAIDPAFVSEIVETLREKTAAADLDGKVTVTGARGGFKVIMDATALFGAEVAVIGDKPRPFLKEMNRIANSVPFFIRVESRGQDRAGKSNGPGRWDLPARRSMAVIRYFHEEGRIDGNRLAAAGFGLEGTAERSRDRNDGGRIEISFNGEEK